MKAAATVIAITFAGFLLDLKVAPTNLAMVYVMGVAVVSLKWGLGAALISSLISTFAFDFLFIPPYRSFAVTDVWYLITAITLMCVALLISLLASAARRQTLAAEERELHTASLYSLTRALSAARSMEQIFRAAADHVKTILACEIEILSPDQMGRLIAQIKPSGCCIDIELHSAATRIFRQASEDASIGHQGSFLPLRTASGTLGVIVLLPTQSHTEISGAQALVLEAVAGQVASAMERVALEEQAREAEVLRKADELQRALLSSVSHSLRAPLAAILSAVNPIADDETGADRSTILELARIAQGEAFRLDTLIGNLLDLSRLETGALKPRKEPADIQDVIGAALGGLRNQQGRQITVTVQPGLPLVSVDCVLIANVLTNLLDNAVKYSPVGMPVSIDAGFANGGIEIRIADRGCGVSSLERAAIFKRFARGSGAQHVPGMGLGLPICKGFVEAHEGRIWLEDRPGGGSIFCFTLPGCQPLCDTSTGGVRRPAPAKSSSL